MVSWHSWHLPKRTFCKSTASSWHLAEPKQAASPRAALLQQLIYIPMF